QDAAGCAAGQIALEAVAVEHAAAMLLDQLARRGAGGDELHARILHTAGDGIAAQTLGAVLALGGEPVRSLPDDLRYPVEGLDIVHESGSVEDADLRHVRRPVAREAALAFDRFDHCRLFAADIGAGAPPEVDLRVLRQPRLLDGGDLPQQNLPRRRIFVAQI